MSFSGCKRTHDVVEDAAPHKRARRSVRFSLHEERHFAPNEPSDQSMELDATSVPTTPTVEARRAAANALRDLAAEPRSEDAAVCAQMRRIVDLKVKALQALLVSRSLLRLQPPTAEEEDPDDLFFERVPHFTRIPGLWGAHDMWPVTPQSLARLRQLQGALLVDAV